VDPPRPASGGSDVPRLSLHPGGGLAYPSDMGEGVTRGDLRHRLAVARGDEPADLLLSGGRVLSVFTGELLETDVAVAGERVAGLGRYRGREVVDCRDLILLPGFVDGHMHIESTKLMVDEFARVALPWGTTTVVLDPHEIANVFGLDGVRALLNASEAVPLDYYVMVSSCVPASPFETGGAEVGPADIARFLEEESRALGLAEMMNFPAIVAGEDGALMKVEVAHRLGRHVDGHAPGLSGMPLNAYLAAGVRSDHECTTLEEAREKRRRGMWIMIREGSAAKNLEALLPLVLEHGPTNTLLCTDDVEPDDLLQKGHLNRVIRKAVDLGCDPVDAVTMGTLNAARYHGLDDHGAVAPGYVADIVTVPDMNEFRPVQVWKRGRLAATSRRAVGVPAAGPPAWMRDSVRVGPLTASAFRIPGDGAVRIIGVEAGQVVTRALVGRPSLRDGGYEADPEQGLAKAAVIERHRGTGRIGLGFVSASAFAEAPWHRPTRTTRTTSWSWECRTRTWPWPRGDWPRWAVVRSRWRTAGCWPSCRVRSGGCCRTVPPRRSARPPAGWSRWPGTWVSPCPRPSWRSPSWRCR
jgi:adenine deaminase